MISKSKLFEMAYKAGYKKALKEAMENQYQQAVKSFAAATIEGERKLEEISVENIIWLWQEKYENGLLYGENPMPLEQLAQACIEGLTQADGNPDFSPIEIVEILKEYQEGE